METGWVPGVNHLDTLGRWAFAEFREVYRIEADFAAQADAMIDRAAADRLEKV